MSKKCKNCGAELADTDKVCSNCGTRVEESTKDVKVEAPKAETTTTTNANTNNYAQPNAKKSMDGKTVGIIAGAVAAFVVIALILVSIFSGNYKTPIDNMFKGVNKASSKTFLKAVPSFMADDLDSKITDSYLEKQKTSLEKKLGDNVKYSYKILDKEKIDKDDLEDVQESLEKKYDVSKKKLKVTQGYKLSLKVTAKGKDDKQTDTTTLKVYKVGGKWCLLSTSF